jgi:hypothetical protein
VQAGLRRTLGAPVYFQLETEYRYFPTPEGFARLRAEVEGKPDHPDAGKVEGYHRMARGEYGSRTQDVWFESPTLFRLARDGALSDGQTYFSDDAVGRDGPWAMTSGVLQYGTPAMAERPNVQLSRAIGVVSGPVFWWAATASGIPMNADIRRDGDTARVEIGRDDISYVYRWVLKERASLGWVIVEATRGYTSSAARFEDDEQVRFVYSDHIEVPGIDLPIAQTATLYAADGQLHSVMRLLSIKVVQASEIEDLARRPSSSRPDTLRGWGEQRVAMIPALPEIDAAPPPPSVTTSRQQGEGGLPSVVIAFGVLGVAGLLGMIGYRVLRK